MIVRNFWFRVGQYLRDNRAGLIRYVWLLVGAMALTVSVWIYVEQWQAARYEKKFQALEKQLQDAKAEAKAAEDRADAIQVAIETKYEELRHVRIRAAQTETLLRNAKTNAVTLKEAYETIRYVPVPIADASVAGACAELARVDHPCQ